MKQISLIVLISTMLMVACGQDQATQTTVEKAVSITGHGLEMREIMSGIWVHTSYHTLDSGIRYPSNGVIVREGDELLLIDPAWGAEATEALLVRIKDEIGLPVRQALATHFHSDRTGGVDVLAKAGIEVFAHPKTLKLSAQEGNPVPRNALVGIDEPGSTVIVGTAEVLYPGAGHAPDNIMVWLPVQKILYGGCAVREMATNSLGNTEDADLASWRSAIRLAEKHYPQAEIVIPGHGKSGGSDLLGHMHQLFETADAAQ